MIWRTLFALLCGYLLFVAYRFYAHSQPVTAIDIRQSHIAQADTLELAVVWPDGPDKDGYVHAVRLIVDQMNEQSADLCSAAEPQAQSNCTDKKLVVRHYAEAVGENNNAVDQARDIVSNKNTLAVLGYYRSDIAIPASTVFEHQGVLMLSSGATNVKFTSYDFRHIFRHAANDNNNAEVLANFIQEEGYINVYVIYERDLYGTDFSNYFIEQLITRGLKVPEQVFYEEHENDFLPLLSSLRSKISPINLTDEIALLRAKLQQAKRMEQIRQLSLTKQDSSIVQFLTAEQSEKSGTNKFFDTMPRVKLLYYLQQELELTAHTGYLQQWFERYQQELSMQSSSSQYTELEQLASDISAWMAQLESANDALLLASAALAIKDNRIVTRKSVDFGQDDTLDKLKSMLKRIARIKSGHVDAIFIAGSMPEVAQAIVQARKLNMTLPVFGGHTLVDLNTECLRQNNCALYGDVYTLVTHDVEEYRQVYEALRQGGQQTEICEGINTELCLPKRYACDHFTTAYSQFQTFASAYQQRYNESPDHWAVQGYLAARIIQHTIATAHTFDPVVLADTLLYQGNSEFTDKGLMFSCNSLGITEGDVLVEGMKIRKLGDLQVSH